MAGSTISSTITNQVTLEYGVTPSPLTITNTGKIDCSGGYGIVVATASDGTIVNDGSIIGGTDGVYAAAYAVTIFNQGSIYGHQFGILLNSFIDGPNVVVNAASISGNIGIAGGLIDVANTGIIDGSAFGIRLSASTIVNSGSIAGQTGVSAQQDVLSNTGTIDGSQTGVYLRGGSAVNYGMISGAVGVRIADLGGGGSLTNDGSIAGGVIVTAGVLDNAAHISGVIGVSLDVAGNVTNSGQIYGRSYGVIISGRTVASEESFINSGSIYSPNLGVTISGAYMKNSGSIGGGNIGVRVSGGLLVNDGLISSQTLAAAISGGSLVNSGTLAGQSDGIMISGGNATNFESISGGTDGALLLDGSLVNYGEISGTADGVNDSNSTLINYGMISSASDGVVVVSRGMVTNAGTIAGGVDAVYGSFITLAVDPGAVFVGNVINNQGASALDLQGTGVGSLGGIGTQIQGFDTINFAGGANWVISGNVAGLADGAPITGMSPLDTIVLDGFAATSNSLVSGGGLEIADATASVTLDIVGNISGVLQVTEAGGDTVITDVTCFAAGSRIATPGGNVAVEQLKIGDLVRTLHGGDRPVKWLGWRRYDGWVIEGNLAALPVCIKRDAIADGVPARDLWVSPGHAIAIDNVLVHASRLVNGVSVVQAPRVGSVTYYHVELESHEILFAENCPAESFQDEHFRERFVNAGDFRRLYPNQVAPEVMCLPRLDSGFQLHAIQRRVAARAGLAEPAATGALRGYVDQAGPERCFGWAQDMSAPDAPVSLDILCGNRLIGRVLANLYRADVFAAGYGSGYQGFEFILPRDGVAGEIELRRSVDGAKLKPAEMAVQRAA
jgi:hypothetical protein